MKRILFALSLLAAPLFAQQTPNLKLNIPPTGTANWGPSINYNFTTLDSVVGGLQAAYQGAWVSTTVYAKGQIVTFGTSAYMSLTSNNVNQTPGISTSWGVLSSSTTGTPVPAPGAAGNAPVSNGTVYTSQAVVLASKLNVASGVAGLDINGKLLSTQIPAITSINGTSVPVSTAADLFFGTSASGVGLWSLMPNCQNDGAHAITYSTSTHAFACTAVAGGGGGVTADAMQEALAPQAGCTTAGFVWVPASNTCVAQSGGSGIPITGTPTAGMVPIAASGTAAAWGQLTQDNILPGFTINAFAGGSVVEIGATVTNPAFTASYSSTPTSAQITNTASIGSPLTLTTPFTSGTVTGAFTETTASSVTFTLSAIKGVTKTSASAITWDPRTFGGIGAAAATNSVAATGTTAVLSNGAVLASAGLNNQTTYGPFSPSAQKVYILMTGGTHTFKDPSTGFSFAFNTPTAVSFVNANGATVAMFLYESSNTLSGTLSVQVVN